MEPIVAFGVAGTLLQFIQFGLELLSLSKEIYESSAGTLAQSVDTGSIARVWMERIENARGRILETGPDVDRNFEELCTSCWNVAFHLSTIISSLKVHGKRIKWASFKAAVQSAMKKNEIEKLTKRFETLRTEIHRYTTSQNLDTLCHELTKLKRDVGQGISKLDALDQGLQEFKIGLMDKISSMPKQLGYFWESGRPSDHIPVDDGLRQPFLVPAFLCSSYQQFVDFIQFCWTEPSGELPGNYQISQRHFELLDWNESTLLSTTNWASFVKHGQGIKMSFIMGSWCGLPKDRCPRCRKKPGYGSKDAMSYRKCGSCKLAIRQVETTMYSYEPQDMTIGFCRDAYWSHRVQSSTKKSTRSLGSPQPQITMSNSDIGQGQTIPAIDLVCRRITFKWEPIFNIVWRYNLCRCIIWRSTPSILTEEMTLLFSHPCPRHNNLGLCFPDYGDIDYRDDPYFNCFGGYDLFRYLISTHWPARREYLLGGDKFFSDEERKRFETSVDEESPSNDENTQGGEEIEDNHVVNCIRDALNRYVFEVNDTVMTHGYKVPDHIAEWVRKERQERDGEPLGFKFSNYYKWEDFPHNKGLLEVLDRTWSGKPHWAIED